MLAQLIAPLRGLSVRARIALIALIPVVGFLVDAIAYRAGTNEVEKAFASSRRADVLADASSEFKSAIMVMFISALKFAANPSQTEVTAFKEAYQQGVNKIAVIEQGFEYVAADRIQSLQTHVGSIGQHFDELVVAQKRLGFAVTDGLRGRTRDASNAVQRLINDGLGTLPEVSGRELRSALIGMRRFEAEYRLSQDEFLRQGFLAEYGRATETITALPGAVTFSTELLAQVKAYADAFIEWAQSKDQVTPHLALIELEVDRTLPEVDQVIASARQNADRISAAATSSQNRTKAVVMAVGLAAVLIGLSFSVLIIRSINRPLHRLGTAMQQLANGDTEVTISGTQAQDEIGDMARTVLVFRNSMIERQRLSGEQSDAVRAREARSEHINSMIVRCDDSVSNALAKLRDAAARLESTSVRLNQAADTVSTEANTAEQRVGVASTNVTGAAITIEELVASINDIASQVSRANDAANHAATESRHTTETMTTLAATAVRIGEVVGLIQSIAAQTNLLALNATIEAARAGEAGRGFAVVAAEVKSLSSQTAQATEGIAGQIRAIQDAATSAVQAIQRVNSVIEDMSTISEAVAATVEEQNAAVANIAEGVNRASTEARTGAEAMSRVAQASAGARSTAADVKSLADTLTAEAGSLEAEVRSFLHAVEAA